MIYVSHQSVSIIYSFHHRGSIGLDSISTEYDPLQIPFHWTSTNIIVC